MTDFQTFAAVFALQNFSTKFKILKKNHFKQKCNGFVTVETHTFIPENRGSSAAVRFTNESKSGLVQEWLSMSVQIWLVIVHRKFVGICFFTRWFIAVADFWLVIFFTRQSWMWFLLVVVIAENSAEPCVNVLFFSSQKIFEYIHDIPLIYLLKHQIINVKEKFLCGVYVVQYISDIFCL